MSNVGSEYIVASPELCKRMGNNQIFITGTEELAQMNSFITVMNAGLPTRPEIPDLVRFLLLKSGIRFSPCKVRFFLNVPIFSCGIYIMSKLCRTGQVKAKVARFLHLCA